MNKIILIILLSISLLGDNIDHNDIAKMDIKKECTSLFGDYVFFREKALKAEKEKDSLYVRWSDISSKYKKSFLECNKKDYSKRKKENDIIPNSGFNKLYYAPNPLNKITK